MLSHVFTTPISRTASGLSSGDLAAAAAALALLRAGDSGKIQSNRGGWHSSSPFFAQGGAPWDAVGAALKRALFDYIGAVFGFQGELEMELVVWAVINRAGDFNVMHNHAANLLSGALYLAVPPQMQGGEIYFQDPRLNLNAHETEAMLRLPLTPPWHAPGIAVAPVPGEILIFPSWLMHMVHPFQCGDPEALRIVLSFNVRV